MEKLIFSLSLAFLLTGSAFAKDDVPSVVPGVITANNVDVTTDSGELLDQRLSIGDPIFIVTKPKKKRDGWVRLAKSQDDSVGYGWVEEKYTRSFRKWENPQDESIPSEAEKSGEKTVFAPDVEPSKYSQIGVAPFTSSGSDESVARSVSDLFSKSLKKDKRFQVMIDDLKSERVNVEAPESVEKVISAHRLDGLFVGNLSEDMGGVRLLQVRFFGKGREGMVLEKVKKLPKNGNLKEIVDNLVTSCTSAISSR